MAPGDVCHGPRCSLAGLGPAALEYRSCHWPGGSAGSPQCVRPMGCWFFPVPRPPYVCAVSWASRLLFTGVPARCVVSGVRRPGPPGSCSPVCPLGVVCCVCGVLGLPAPVHRCARSVCCVVCAVSWASRLLFTGVSARCVVLRVRCPGPPGSCSPVCPLGVLCCVCGVLGLPAPVHRCARSVCCVACAVSWASRLLFTAVPARCVVLRVRRPGAPGSCSPVCPLGVLCCVCGVLGLLAPVHRCARSVCCVACAVSWASRLLFTGVPARCVALRVRCPGPPGSCSPVCPLGVLFCVCGVLGLPAPVDRCACSVCCVACAVSWASRLLFTCVPARCVVLRVRCTAQDSTTAEDTTRSSAAQHRTQGRTAQHSTPQRRAAATKTARQKGGAGGGSNRRGATTSQAESTQEGQAHGEPRGGRPTKQTTHSAGAQGTRGRKPEKAGDNGGAQGKKGRKKKKHHQGTKQERQKPRDTKREGGGVTRPKSSQRPSGRHKRGASTRRAGQREAEKNNQSTAPRQRGTARAAGERGATPARRGPSKAERQSGQRKK